MTKEYKGNRFHVDPLPGGKTGTRMVTMVGEGAIKPGDHRLNLVLHRPGIDEKPHTTQVLVNLPEVPRRELFFNGPFLARAVPEGALLRSEDTRSAKGEGPSPLEQTLGPGATFEPLFVYRIDTDDMLLVAWSACIVDGELPTNATVERQIVDDAGNVVFALDRKALALTGTGKVRCHGELDNVPGGKLAPGDYQLAILARDAAGTELLKRAVPLLVEAANPPTQAAAR